MGIPYSKQINAAFDQVTPLVAEGFKVLETTKNISILLAIIQVLTLVLLSLILGALIALLITCNPDLVHERHALVTPVLKWFTAWLLDEGARRYLALVIFVIILGSGVGAVAGFKLMKQSDMADEVKRLENSTQADNDDDKAVLD